MIAITTFSTVGVPLGALSVLLSEHAASFAGSCGPYPTDIPAYACTFGEYVEGFFEPFAAAALLVMVFTLAAVTFWASAFAGLLWIVAPRDRR